MSPAADDQPPEQQSVPAPGEAPAAGDAAAAPDAPAAEQPAAQPAADKPRRRPRRRRRRRKPVPGGEARPGGVGLEHAQSADAAAPAPAVQTEGAPNRPPGLRGPGGRRPRHRAFFRKKEGFKTEQGGAAPPPQPAARDGRPRPEKRDRDWRPRGFKKRPQQGGREPPRKKPEPKLYSVESVVDHGFEDVADAATEGGMRRVDWTILKRMVADQRSARPVSAVYVLRREGGETEFANLSAARAAVNKTIVHPEKLTRSKADYAAAKKSK